MAFSDLGAEFLIVNIVFGCMLLFIFYFSPTDRQAIFLTGLLVFLSIIYVILSEKTWKNVKE